MISHREVVLLKALGTKNLCKRTLAGLLEEKNVLKSLSECCHNTLIGNVKLTQEQKQKLEKYKRIVRLVSCKKVPDKIKKKLVIQHGGFLQFLLPAAAGALGSLLMK